MKKTLLSAATLAVVAFPNLATAQALPAVTIGYIDLQKVVADCNACKAAATALTSQENAIKARARTLGTPLEAEQKAIQAAIDAKNGEPDAALQARITAFQTKQQQGSQEVQRSQATLQRNAAYVQQQILAKLFPIMDQVRAKRGAGIIVNTSDVLSVDPRLDLTADALAALNAGLPSVSTTAPAQAAAPASTAPRAAAPKTR